MALNSSDWAHVTQLRELYGAEGRDHRWSLTTGGFDDRGRRRQFRVVKAGPYPGGLSEPFFFDDFMALEHFLSEPLTAETREMLKKQEKRKASVIALPTKVRRTRRKAA